MGADTLSKDLQVSKGEAQRILDDYKTKYPQTIDFIKLLSYKEEVVTPILRRKIRFSKYKEHSKFNLGYWRQLPGI